MHATDVVLIGPIGPLLPRPLRVRLVVALAAAITLILLCAGMLVAAALTLRPSVSAGSNGWPLGGLLPPVTSDANSSTTRALQVVSRPAGATILLNLGQLGHTPATITVAPQDLLALHRDGFLDAFVRADGANVNIPLWRAQPDVRVLRPPVPGASIRSADFLPDGRVALAIELPPNSERQAWLYDPRAAREDRLGGGALPGIVPSVVAIAPDPTHIATIVHLDGLVGAAADQLTLDGPEGPQQPLSSLDVDERLLDASWSPDAGGVLLLSSRRIAGGAQFQLRFVGTGGRVRDVAELPGEPVTGSWVWAPDGCCVAFLVRTSITSLVALDLATGEVRYLDDLVAEALPASGAIAPAAWEQSGDLLYAGRDTNDGFSGSATPMLFQVTSRRTDAHRVGNVQPVWAPIVRVDGIILTLARGDSDVLVLRPLDQDGHVLAEQRLGVQVSGAFAARWDLQHRQLLIVRGATGGGVNVLLLRFGTDDSPSGGDSAGSADGLQ